MATRIIAALLLLVFSSCTAMAGGSPGGQDPFSGFDDTDNAFEEGFGETDETGAETPAKAPVKGEWRSVEEIFPLDAAEENREPQDETDPELSFSGIFPDRISGYTRVGTAVNIAHDAPDPGETDWRGLSRLRAELQLEADFRRGGWKLFISGKGTYDVAYALNGRSDYTEEVLDAYESELELREAYLQGAPTDTIDLTIGRQIAVWGRSDNFRTCDLLNPLDNREPGLIDIEDLRLPLAMTKVDLYHGDWNLSLIAIHEHRFDKLPAFGHDFFPGSTPGPPERIPAQTLENTEYAGELTGIFNNWDLSFYGASLYNDLPSFVPGPVPALTHPKITMAGAAMTCAAGNFLFIAEAAHIRGLRYGNDPGKDYNRTDLLAGVEYRGFKDTSISLDLLNRHLHGYGDLLETSFEAPLRNDFQAALRITRTLMNERLELTALFVSMGEHARNGSFERLTATWEIGEGLSMTGDLVTYQSGTGTMANAGDNDRIALAIRQDF